MRLQYIYNGKEREPHPFHVKSDWNAPVQPSVALETFLEEVELELAEIQFKKPKPNLTPGELQALKQLSRDKTIIHYKTTLLLRPYSFKPNVKTIESFYYFEDPVNATTSLLRPGFYGPTVVALTGFHCTQKGRQGNNIRHDEQRT